MEKKIEKKMIIFAALLVLVVLLIGIIPGEISFSILSVIGLIISGLFFWEGSKLLKLLEKKKG